jgi:hypothetical protein
MCPDNIIHNIISIIKRIYVVRPKWCVCVVCVCARVCECRACISLFVYTMYDDVTLCIMMWHYMHIAVCIQTCSTSALYTVWRTLYVHCTHTVRTLYAHCTYTVRRTQKKSTIKWEKFRTPCVTYTWTMYVCVLCVCLCVGVCVCVRVCVCVCVCVCVTQGQVGIRWTGSRMDVPNTSKFFFCPACFFCLDSNLESVAGSRMDVPNTSTLLLYTHTHTHTHTHRHTQTQTTHTKY